MDYGRIKNCSYDRINLVIISFFLIVAGSLLALVADLFSALSLISYIIPPQIGSAFTLFFSYAHIADGVYPMTDTIFAILSVLTVWILLYTIKVILFAFSAIPWVGKVLNLPKHTTDNFTRATWTQEDDGKEHFSRIKGIETRTKKTRWGK